MKKLLLLATVALLAAAPAKADVFNFTISDGHGTGPFGEVTTTDLGGGDVHVAIDMSPNWVIENGGDAHHALTFSTTLAGSITNLSAGFQALAYDPTASYDNKPFTGFTDAIIGVNCASNGNGGCGSTISFDLNDFGLFTTADAFNMNAIFAAVDIFDKATGKTFVVGLTDNPTPGLQIVPTPIAGSGPLFVSGLAGLWALMRRRKKKLGLDLPA